MADNRMCLSSFMGPEIADLPEAVAAEVRAFAKVNVAWLGRMLSDAGVVGAGESDRRAWAIFSAMAGAQRMARSRRDVALFDSLIDSYRNSGPLPG